MAMTTQMTSVLDPDLSNGPAGKTTTEQDRPWPGQQALSVICATTAHFLSSCPILAEYTQLGKFLGMCKTFSYLAMVTPFQRPMSHCGCSGWRLYSRNPHLPKTSSTYASKLCSQSTWGNRKSPWERNLVFSLVEFINERWELGLLGARLGGQASLDRYIEYYRSKGRKGLSQESPDLQTSTHSANGSTSAEKT